MEHRFILAALAATTLSLCATALPAAAQQTDEATAETTATKPKSTEARRKEIAAQRKAYAKRKLVDINGASKDELKKLPGVDDAAADRIIAGRPYGSKAWLVTQKVIPDGTFQAIKDRIVATQQFKSAADIDSAYGKKK